MQAGADALRLRDLHPVMDGNRCTLLYDLERTFVLTVPQSLQEIMASVIAGALQNSEARAWLAEEGLLTQDSRRQLSDPHDWALPPVTDVSLDLAGSCNMACTYCFEDAIHSRVGKMSQETRRASLEFAFRQAAPSKRLSLHFGSGEPLLRFEELRQVFEEASLRAVREGVKLSFELTTNGTLVTDDIARFLADNPVNVRVSCDGPRELHDVFRPMAGGQPSYDRVRSGLLCLLKHLPERVTVNTVICGRTRLDQVWGWAKSLGVRHFHVIKVGAYDDRSINLQRSELAHFREDLEVIAGEIFQDLENGRRPIDYQPLTKVIRRLMIPQPITRFCGVASSYLGVAADGRVYPCFRHLGLKDLELGSVSDTVLRDDRRYTYLKELAPDVDNRPVCNECWARYLCGGGCYADSVVYGPTATHPQLNHCPFWRLEIETAIRLYERLRSADPCYCLRLFGADDGGDFAFVERVNCS